MHAAKNLRTAADLDDEEARSRQRARAALDVLWARASRPGARLTATDYRAVYQVVHRNAELRFGSVLDDVEIHRVVAFALHDQLPALFLRPFSDRVGTPDDVFDALDNAALDVHAGVQPTCEGRSCHPRRSTDREIVWSVFGHDDRDYEAALGEARRQGSRMEFLVVTEYLSKREVWGRAPSWQEIADNLSTYGITAAGVERLMFRFTRRLAARERR